VLIHLNETKFRKSPIKNGILKRESSGDDWKRQNENAKKPHRSLNQFQNRSYHEFKLKIQRPRYDVNCKAIIEMNQNEIIKAKKKLNDLRKSNSLSLLNDENYIFNKSMCHLFKQIRRYNQFDKYTTQIEKNFPLAYIILIYNNVEQFERLLRSIYRSHNIYCIHVDRKSSEKFKQAVESIVNCFDNVFITSKLERIVYADFTRLKADLNCMNDLVSLRANKTNSILKSKKVKYVDWKYLINMASSEFPLRTNYELVKILKMYNGSNEIEILNALSHRTKYIYKVDYNGQLKSTNSTKSKPPHNYTIRKGSAYGVFSYKFIEYVLTNKQTNDFINWINDTYSPDETIWATIQFNTQFNPPGGFYNRIDELLFFILNKIF
jgi:hypothetical protein